MTIHLSTIVTVGKSLAIRREKDDDAEITRAHLKVTDLFVTREQINALCGMRPGWAEPLLGRECRAEWTLTDGGQRDLLRERAA